ncbi:ATP-binding protein [Xanthomonas massiliensis]|uniref:ATP-binding protein n=1 Tax=Xanthomonas massiliensis TaxID=1720302 RepID=UPI0008261408|nr:ATP-binding protein [Xanthomonas massiliensis]
MRSATDLFEELNSVDESTRIEAKRASELGKSVMQTVIAFANEPGLEGGYLLLGADWFVNDKGDTVYRAAGLPDPDKVQRDLASQCASMLNVALRPEMQTETVDGKTVLVVYVSEADVTQKPVYLKATGLPRGAYRRIGSSDQHCVDEDLWVLRGESQPLHGPDSSILPNARLDDFDPAAVASYRRERARINPQAEELDYGDEDLLEALGALRRVDGQLQPTLAGIVLFGKPLALRRLLPMVRIDYIRVPGNEWVEDPENRFQSIDIRKPLLLALPQAEASIIDELPKGFRLPEGQLHSVQEPILPRKVIREALANAAMHRSYTVHSPTQIIRYSNRIEIRNVGYSLKEPAQLGTPGSRLRNPAISAVLHDLHLAEAKGTGIRAMRRLAAEAGLPLPEFHSDRQANEFRLTLFLHNLLTEDDHAWLREFAGPAVSADEAKVLIYTRATGAVDNTACRDFCGLDTLAASLVLRRLRDRGLLEKQGAGSRTYYVLADAERQTVGDASQAELPLGIPVGSTDGGGGDSPPSMGGFPESPHVLADVPPELQARITAAGPKPRQAEVRELILTLCALRPYTVAELCQVLGRRDTKELRRTYLRPLRDEGRLALKYPETEKHPHQAYATVERVVESGDE